MPNLENPGPIRRLTIIQRTIEELNGAALAGIVWGTNNKPFPEALNEWFEGPTNWGGLDPATVDANYGALGLIEASTLTEAIRNITQYYTRVRNIRCVRVITGNGGNTPAGPYTSTTQNVDLTRIAFTRDGQQPTIISNYFDIQSSSLIYRGNINNFILGMSQRYQILRPNILGDDGTSYKISICHTSCHSSCHSSRGRR